MRRLNDHWRPCGCMKMGRDAGILTLKLTTHCGGSRVPDSRATRKRVPDCGEYPP